MQPGHRQQLLLAPRYRTSRVRFGCANVSAWCSHSPPAINPIIDRIQMRSISLSHQSKI